MAAKGVDYSFARPGGAAIAAAGFTFAMRYCPYSGDGGKGLTLAELDDLHANGIAVGLVYESTAGRPLAGYEAGDVDATVARAAMQQLAFPDDRPMYFAVDFNARPDHYAVIDQYLSGAASVLGLERVGVYGSYDVCAHCFMAATAKWFWQTYAWSAGKNFEWRNVYQYLNGQSLNGAAVDYNEAYGVDFGQWPVEDEMTPADAYKLEAVWLALTAGDMALIEQWNANGNSLLAGYTGEQKKLAEHIENHPSGGDDVLTAGSLVRLEAP